MKQALLAIQRHNDELSRFSFFTVSGIRNCVSGRRPAKSPPGHRNALNENVVARAVNGKEMQIEVLILCHTHRSNVAPIGRWREIVGNQAGSQSLRGAGVNVDYAKVATTIIEPAPTFFGRRALLDLRRRRLPNVPVASSFFLVTLLGRIPTRRAQFRHETGAVRKPVQLLKLNTHANSVFARSADLACISVPNPDLSETTAIGVERQPLPVGGPARSPATLPANIKRSSRTVGQIHYPLLNPKNSRGGPSGEHPRWCIG